MNTLRIFDNPPREPVLALLAANGLPTADLTPDSAARFFAAGTPESIRGVVAIEVHGEHGVLRSLAVTADERGAGIGSRLFAHAEKQAGAMGISTLYLLTQTATTFFARYDYTPADRTRGPALIAATPEFAELCPANATCMSKSL